MLKELQEKMTFQKTRDLSNENSYGSSKVKKTSLNSLHELNKRLEMR